MKKHTENCVHVMLVNIAPSLLEWKNKLAAPSVTNRDAREKTELQRGKEP